MESGLPVLRCIIARGKWDTKSAMRLLLGLAHIERAVHRSVAASWVSHAIHFGGVWLHPSHSILQGPGIKQLASVLSSLERESRSCGGGESVWGNVGAFQSPAHSSAQ